MNELINPYMRLDDSGKVAGDVPKNIWQHVAIEPAKAVGKTLSHGFPALAEHKLNSSSARDDGARSWKIKGIPELNSPLAG